MARSKSSKRWLQRQHSDDYVKRARSEGYRSRAAYKLLELQEKDRLLHSGQLIVDLGAAPGGWSQVASRMVGNRGAVIALDLLPMEPLEGVTFLQGDFREQELLERLQAALGKRRVDLVICDMAPNISGVIAVDQPRSMLLVELALDFSVQWLKPEGGFVCKLLQGEGFDEFLRVLRGRFSRVVTRKPQASRANSREVYSVARGFRV